MKRTVPYRHTFIAAQVWWAAICVHYEWIEMIWVQAVLWLALSLMDEFVCFFARQEASR